MTIEIGRRNLDGEDLALRRSARRALIVTLSLLAVGLIYFGVLYVIAR